MTGDRTSELLNYGSDMAAAGHLGGLANIASKNYKSQRGLAGNNKIFSDDSEEAKQQQQI